MVDSRVAHTQHPADDSPEAETAVQSWSVGLTVHAIHLTHWVLAARPTVRLSEFLAMSNIFTFNVLRSCVVMVTAQASVVIMAYSVCTHEQGW